MSEPGRRLLVTGGAGFIGANFVHYWSRQYPEDHIVVLDALTYAGNKHNLAALMDTHNSAALMDGALMDTHNSEALVDTHNSSMDTHNSGASMDTHNSGAEALMEEALMDTHNSEALVDTHNFEFVRGSITDGALVEQLLRERAIDTLIHFAAESHVDRSITGPDAFIETNIVGTHTLLKAAKAVWLDAEDSPRPHHFHHVSTDEVYGTLAAADPAFAETTPYAPNSPYAASKAASDHLVRAYHHTYGLRVTTSNCSNNYGPYHFPEKLIPLCLLNILAGKPLPIYGDGRQIRDWLHVQDHSRGIDLIINQGRPGHTYNIGGNNEWANIDVVRLLCQLLDRQFADNPNLGRRFPDSPCARGKPAADLITFVTDRPGHDTRYAIDAGKIMNELGYAPQVDFATGLAGTVQWYLDNEPWWRAIQDGSYREK